MKRIFVLSIFLFFSILSFAQYTEENLKLHRKSNTGNAEPTTVYFEFENLRIYPIVCNDAFLSAHKHIGKYTPLEEAIKQKKISIREVGASSDTTRSNNDTGSNEETAPPNIAPDPIEEININQVQQIQIQGYQYQNIQGGGISGEVNKLIGENLSSDTIFLMAGEIVKGGKQDRVIGEDIVLLPGQKVDLSAFCVEKGRWTTKNNNQGHFTGYYQVTSNSVRKKVVKDKNQSMVWEEVANVTKKNKAESHSGAYTALENNEEYNGKVSSYTGYFNGVKLDTNTIGFIAVSGDKILGADLFATPHLFHSAYKRLIHAYITESITTGALPKVTQQKVDDYLKLTLKDDDKKYINENGSYKDHKGSTLHINTY